LITRGGGEEIALSTLREEKRRGGVQGARGKKTKGLGRRRKGYSPVDWGKEGFSANNSLLEKERSRDSLLSLEEKGNAKRGGIFCERKERFIEGKDSPGVCAAKKTRQDTEKKGAFHLLLVGRRGRFLPTVGGEGKGGGGPRCTGKGESLDWKGEGGKKTKHFYY